jgi:GNAT superfamily N-acetyltransferase
MSEGREDITFRPMVAADIGRVPIGCQGEIDAVRARIGDLGASAILALEGGQHVAQLQFRRYRPGIRSPNRLWDPLYWVDFAGHAPELPERTLALFCYHVGQLDDTERRDPRYQGRGLGYRLLDACLAWAREAGFEAVIAKATPSLRPVMAFMGGQPAEGYRARGFDIVARWVDADLLRVVRERSLVPEGADSESAAEVGCCVRWLNAVDRLA